MKRFCFDTSAITNPIQTHPLDLHPTLWNRVIAIIDAGEIAMTTEIYEELDGSVEGLVGQSISTSRARLVMEIGVGDWEDAQYVWNVKDLLDRHRNFIAEYVAGNPRKTVCVNDISGVALAKTLNLPLVSMETSATNSPKYRRIPDICRLDGIEHLDFNQFLRRTNVVI